MITLQTKIPTQRIPDQPPSPVWSTLRVSTFIAARRQSYRYGYQVRQLTPGTREYYAVRSAWEVFIDQFEDVRTIDHLTSQFKIGVNAAENDERLFI
jgi:hypothetical protein